ncbi:unnamed protein product, partial [Ectocarpus sp. 12 AP-2014]
GRVGSTGSEAHLPSFCQGARHQRMDYLEREYRIWSKTMQEHNNTTVYNSYAGASATVIVTGAIVLDGAWALAKKRWRLSRSTDDDRAARHVYKDWAKASAPFSASNSGPKTRLSSVRYGRGEHGAGSTLALSIFRPSARYVYEATTDATSPGARRAAVHCLCRLLAEMSARQPFSSPAPMIVVSLTAENFRVPPSPYLRLCHFSQFPPSTPPPGSILLNRGIDGSMVRPGRATAAPLSVRWLDIELEEEEEARRRERGARLAEEEEEAHRRELDSMLSAGGGGRGTEGGSSWAVHPEAAAVEGVPRRWESTR